MRQATAQPGAATMAGNANGRGLWAPVRLGRHQMGACPVILRAAPAGGPQLATITPQKPVTVQQVAHEESQLAILASHLSLEGDFKPEQVWPGLKRDSLHATTTTSNPSGKQALSSLETQQVLHPLLAEVQMLEQLMAALQRAYSTADKVMMLAQHPRVASFLADSRHSAVVRAIYQLDVEEQFVLLVLPAMGQEHVLSLPADAEDSGVESTDVLAARLATLASSLQRVEVFYDSIGGLLGYQCRSLDLIIEGTAELRDVRKQQATNNRDTIARDQAKQQTVTTSNGVRYHVPRALDLAGEGGREVGARTAAAGLDALPFMAEIYPVGGAGDRLGLTDEATGECLPSAMLPYCGRTMMEGLMRDLVAREYLYYKLTGRQVTTPVAVMTSEAKGNHTRITNLMEKLGWFGRGRNAFRVFKQPLVPVISVSDGRWLLSDVMQPMSKPGGHGAIWKLMRDEGVFDWMQSMGRKAALVRQISNPMAGMDTTLLALAGSGAARPNAAFGFMSCDRTIGASEGCNVLQERKVVGPDGRVQYEYGYTNIEYTEFERLGISDQAVDGTSRRSVFPANTNVLYVGLQPAAQVVEDAVATGNAEQLMPGLIFNLNKKVAYKDPLTGEQTQLHAGRMECTMQNIADFLTDRLEQPLSPKDASLRPLSTFLVYNMRRKVTSSAKKKREPGSTRISQTPDGSFYDLQRNAWHLLQQCCVQHVPELGSVEQYLEQGPGFIFLFNPALGPLWDVISQKVLGGSLHQGSEMVLEVAEARLHSVHVKGSFLVHADNVTGHMEESFAEGDQPERRHQYSSRCGRIHMTNVHIENEGIDWAAPSNLYWKHQVARRESVQVLLRGHSEFEAHNVTLKGSHTFEVPDGFRMVVSQDAAGNLNVNLSPMRWGMPTWQWVYTMSELGNVHLQFVSNGCSNPLPTTGLTSKSAGGAARAQALARRRTSVQPVHRHVPAQPAASSQVAHAVAAGPAPAAAMWPLLEQLSETDATLDFTI